MFIFHCYINLSNIQCNIYEGSWGQPQKCWCPHDWLWMVRWDVTRHLVGQEVRDSAHTACQECCCITNMPRMDTLRWRAHILLCVLPTPTLEHPRPCCHWESIKQSMRSPEVVMGSALGAYGWHACMLCTMPCLPIQFWPVPKQYTRWPFQWQLSSHLHFKVSVVIVSMSPRSLCFRMVLDYLKLLSEHPEMKRWNNDVQKSS